jgi:23S rRNA (guanosine2251-2'-O)-methyltransferase
MVKARIKYQDFVYGVHPVIELLQAKRRKISNVYTLKRPIKSWGQIQKLIPSYATITYLDRESLEKMAGTDDHQGILVFAAPFPYAKEMFTIEKQKFILVLDGIQDVRNIGAMLRSAYCTGVDGVILCSRGGTLLTPAAFKSSAGLAEHLQIFVVPTIMDAIGKVKHQKYNIFLATLDKGERASDIQYKAPVALVIGNEAVGISKEIMNNGTRVLLAQKRPDISYNASVAAGILLHDIGVKIKAI